MSIPTQIMLRVYFEMNFEIIFASSFKSQALGSSFEFQLRERKPLYCLADNLTRCIVAHSCMTESFKESCLACTWGSSPTRGSSFFLGIVIALGVLCCFALFVCLNSLASLILPSFCISH